MKNFLQFLLFFSLLSFSTKISAQKKYAILIGIDQYYDKPGVPRASKLRGCVNDVNAIKGMLLKRFGFEDRNIILLTDEKADRKNFERAIQTTLQKAKTGDAFFFYFSGHGVWMENNAMSKEDWVLKQGMNQAIVLSDLYADNLGCLFRDKEIKRMFNKFVDKKVISTGIFDCCFSGNMAQALPTPEHNPYKRFKPSYTQRSFEFRDVVTTFLNSNDSLRAISEEIFNSIDLFPTSDSMESAYESRGFNLKDALAIHDKSFVVRPSERPNSMFLSISATDEYQKGEEMKDASGTYHGVFTKSLLQTIDENPSNISVKDLFAKVQKLIKEKGFHQTPTRFQDKQRISKNLIGISDKGFRNNIEAKLISISGNQFTLNAGKSDGLSIGNVLSLNGHPGSARLEITSVNPGTSIAKLITGTASMLKINDRFIRTDNFIKTNPVIKLYIPSDLVSTADFEKDMKSRVIPYSQLKAYRHYKNWYYNEQCDFYYLKNGTLSTAAGTPVRLTMLEYRPFFIFLSLPSNLFNDFKKKMLVNQNYDLVNDPDKADLALHFIYTGDGYIFTWAPVFKGQSGVADYYTDKVEIKDLPKTKEGNIKLSNDLLELTKNFTRQYTQIWMNDKEKRPH